MDLAPPSFAALTWNTRALCARERPKALAKWNFIHRFLHKHSIIALQETHGNEWEQRKSSLQATLSLHVFLNPHESRNVGGTILMLSYAVLPKDFLSMLGKSLQSTITCLSRAARI